ncbi:hypothetical protein BpHYR1_031248 [Brachionus plicatilis]|uniref:Uncharacterized protein n=1 Tax=Brachionus plicatilis TaxID=10195 RepID=A0A3M7S090_BRAPC|nr:hypothetical protein BpHYR1_031248 [Brachionus plicatilis]
MDDDEEFVRQPAQTCCALVQSRYNSIWARCVANSSSSLSSSVSSTHHLCACSKSNLVKETS